MSDRLYVAGWASDLDQRGNIWISHFGMNGLFKYSITCDELSYIRGFEGVALDGFLIHNAVFCTNESIFFSSIIDNKAYAFNTVSNDMIMIKLPQRQGVQNAVLFRSKKEIYAKLADNSVYRIDEDDYGITYCSEITDLMREFEKRLDVTPANGSVYTNGRFSVYEYNDGICCIYRNRLRFIDLKTLDYKDVTLQDKAVFQLFFNGNKLWYTHHFDTDIVCYDIVSGESILYRGDDVVWKDAIRAEDRVRPYSSIFFVNDEIIIPGYRADGFYQIDKIGKTIKKWKKVKEPTELNDWSNNDLNPRYYRLFQYGDEIVFVPNSSKLLIRYDMNTGLARYKDFSIEVDAINNLGQLLVEIYKGGIVNEGESLRTINSFLKAIRVM